MATTKAKIEKMLSEAMEDLVFDHFMIANIILSIGGAQLTDENVYPAMAWVNPDGIFLNVPYMIQYESEIGKNITPSLIKGLLAHEAGHLLNFTMERENNRNHKLWNIATDQVINSLIINNRKNGRSAPIGTLPEGIVYNPEWVNLTAEEVYEQLKDKFMQQLKQQQQQGGSGNGDGQQQPSDGDGDGQGSGGDLLPIDPDDDLGQAIQKEFNQKCNLDAHEGLENMSENEKSEMVGRVDRALKSCSHDGNSMTERLFQTRDVPKFPWRNMLEKHLHSFKKSNSTWVKINRKNIYQDLRLPTSDITKELNVVIGIDTSGSMSDEIINKVMAHIKKIMDSYPKYEIELHCFSTKVHTDTIKTFTNFNSNELPLQSYKLESYGGTDIKSSFDYASGRIKKFDIFICMTDGYDSISDLEYTKTPVIWAIVGNKEFTNPPKVKRGEVIFIED